MPFWVALRIFTTHAGAARPQSVPRCRRWVSYFSCSRHMFTLYFLSCTHLIGVWGIYPWFTRLLNVVKNLNANFREFLTRVFLVGAEIPMRWLVSSSISNMAAACVVMRAWGSQQAAWRPAGRPVTGLWADRRTARFEETEPGNRMSKTRSWALESDHPSRAESLRTTYRVSDLC